MGIPSKKLKTKYAEAYRKVNFRKHPLKYKIGKGEQGVLMAEPYKSEILPHWKFKTPAIARKSSRAISAMFRSYLKAGDFVGADMARKFLQMGWTRARRYANHRAGKKYDANGKVRPQAADALTSEKAQSAEIFFRAYKRALANRSYLRLKAEFLAAQSGSSSTA